MFKAFLDKIIGKDDKKDAKPKKTVPAAVKFEVLNRQQNKCAICRRSLKVPEFDHIIPAAFGGGNDVNNIQALCPECHRIKTKFDRLLLRRKDKLSLPKKKVIIKTLEKGWLYIGEQPYSLDAVPNWVLNCVPNLTFKLNDDGYPCSIVKGRTFEYLVLMYSKGNYLFFKRLRSDRKRKNRKHRRRR